ncbi:MAG: hypothetical protein KF862_03465 [Chitinophagaceae bacterium]|nr:hypothetical protein [Chitinophagaceae bacterium]
MNRLLIILNTYKSLGVIPDPDNFEAIVSILEELNFKKDESSVTRMTRKELSEWLIQFIRKNRGTTGTKLPNTSTRLLKLNNKATDKLLKLRFGTNGDIRNFEDDFDDLHND